MHARTILALATLAAAPLAAQRSHAFEFGVFGSFTRYDRAFNLDNQIGGGGRLGYFFGEHMGVELDAGYQAPSAKTGPAASKLSVGSASLVLNFGSERNTFYLLGGYSRLDFEDSTPYRFTDNAMHGAWATGSSWGTASPCAWRCAPSTPRARRPPSAPIGPVTSSAHWGCPRSSAAKRVTSTAMASPTTKTRAPARPRAPSWIRAAVPPTPTATPSITGSTPVPTPRWAPTSMLAAVPPTRTKTASTTGSTSAPGRPRARKSTPRAVPPTPTATASPTEIGR